MPSFFWEKNGTRDFAQPVVDDDVTVVEKFVEKYVKFYKSIFHRNNWYFWGFVFAECLNYVILFVNFRLMDVFLEGKFWYFGWNVVKFEQLSLFNQTITPNPLCQVFPLVTRSVN